MARRLEIFDPLYGQFSLPEFLEGFLETPEFRRLGSVRLLNFESLNLSSLSEVRRLSHTLGVLHLGTRLPNFGIGENDLKALLFAIVLHDIGTPPFAHTLEYEFVRRDGLDHEEISLLILDAKHHKLNLDHQIFRGRSVQLNKLIAATGVENEIRDILLKRHPLSKLLFSDIDIDNIDNVYRMALFLGKKFDRQSPLELVSEIGLDQHGNKTLRKSKKNLVKDWLDCRKFSYRAILDTKRHRQNQAVFSRIVFDAMEAGIIGRDDWFLTDERLLQKLSSRDELSSHFINLHRNPDFREIVFGVSPSREMSRNDLLDHRDKLSEELEGFLNGDAYITLINYGSSISRLVSFLDPDDSEIWSVGETISAYRLHIFGAPNLMSGGVAKSESIVRSIVEKYADNHGWTLKNPSINFG